MAVFLLCSVPGCGKSTLARGLCSQHYQRFMRHGDPLAGRTSKGEPERYLREVALKYEGDDCLIWPFARMPNGYPVLHRIGSVHRFVCEQTYGPPPSPKHEATHDCGKGHEGCINKRHLSWKTHAGNMADKDIHDTNTRGVRQWQAKLTESAVRTIRHSPEPGHALARRFGVSPTTISKVRSRVVWAWVTD